MENQRYRETVGWGYSGLERQREIQRHGEGDKEERRGRRRDRGKEMRRERWMGQKKEEKKTHYFSNTSNNISHCIGLISSPSLSAALAPLSLSSLHQPYSR